MSSVHLSSAKWDDLTISCESDSLCRSVGVYILITAHFVTLASHSGRMALLASLQPSISHLTNFDSILNTTAVCFFLFVFFTFISCPHGTRWERSCFRQCFFEVPVQLERVWLSPYLASSLASLCLSSSLQAVTWTVGRWTVGGLREVQAASQAGELDTPGQEETHQGGGGQETWLWRLVALFS